MKVLSVAHALLSETAAHGGGQTYAYYMKQIALDPEIELQVICMHSGNTKTVADFDAFHAKGTVLFTKGGMIRNCKRIFWDLYGKVFHITGLNSYYKHREYKKEINKLRKRGYIPDVVILEWAQCLSLVKEVKKVFPDSKIVASEHDVMFLSYERQAEIKKGIAKNIASKRAERIKCEELSGLKCCDIVMPHNEKDKALLLDNGISENKIHAITANFHNYSTIKRCSINHDVLFWGAMSRPENYEAAIWFIQNVMPAFSEMDVRFVVAGNKPHHTLLELASDKVIITGFVEDPVSLFQHSMCLCAPLKVGAGIKIKVLEAMSAGIPVLTNHIGIEGIPARPGVDYLHCDTAKEYIENINELLMNTSLEKKLSTNEKLVIDRNFNLQESGKAYIDMLHNLIS
jgi:glycosyltransferase involved in cell wall biosynthesis